VLVNEDQIDELEVEEEITKKLINHCFVLGWHIIKRNLDTKERYQLVIIINNECYSKWWANSRRTNNCYVYTFTFERKYLVMDYVFHMLGFKSLM